MNESAATASMRVKDLAARVLAEKWFVAGCGAIAFVLGCIFLMLATPVYTAELSVAPPSTTQMTTGNALSGLSEMLGSSGGVAPDTFKLYLELLTSQAAAERVEHDHHVMTTIFAGRWDAQNQRWRPRSGTSAMLSNAMHGFFGRPNTPDNPSIQDLADFIASSIKVDTPVLGSPSRVITFTNPDPKFAAQFLLWLHQAADELVRETTRVRTTAMIGYIRSRLPEIANTDEHTALSSLLLQQEHNMTLLSSTIDYSAMVIDPPLIPTKPFPALTRTLVLFAFAGLGAGCIIVIAFARPAGGRVRSYFRWALDTLAAAWDGIRGGNMRAGINRHQGY